MSRSDSPPFGRGQSYFNGDWIDTSDLTNIGGEDYEGREYDVEDTVHATGATVTLRVVRNMSTTPVYAGLAYLHDETGFCIAGYNGRVNGHPTALGLPVLVADELTPAIGVPQYDLAYMVVDGPVAIQLPAVVTTALAIGNRVMADSSGTGTFIVADFSGAAAVLAENILNNVGVVLGGLAGSTTTSQGNSTVVVEINDIDD